MPSTILVTYASRTGSTQGVAEAIGRTLAAQGASVDVQPMSAVKDLTRYSAVVAGSAIRGGKWLPEALDFVQTQRDVLSQRPFAAFMVCITLAMANGTKYRAGLESWMDPVRTLVEPVSVGYFAGSLELARLPFFPERVNMAIPAALGIFPRGDHRDWDAVAAWAGALSPLLQGERSTALSLAV